MTDNYVKFNVFGHNIKIDRVFVDDYNKQYSIPLDGKELEQLIECTACGPFHKK